MVLGLVVASRWITVYRNVAAPGPSLTRSAIVSRNATPLPIVLIHGLLAVTTLVLVLLTALGIGNG